jgi:peptidoglycan/LPS O-acetylase OafA/YrhL
MRRSSSGPRALPDCWQLYCIGGPLRGGARARRFRWFGSFSYSIYIVHLPFVTLFTRSCIIPRSRPVPIRSTC